ncbi:GNAT family N-acetyltransferase [Catenulispora subtropica]|uniref:GNAT family N-acetyltransferase n=1 Tax=Catenulispora subtropica TaxID=450798 RepID=A0ABP5DPP6_9ACTN
MPSPDPAAPSAIAHPDIRLRAVLDADLPVFFEHQRDPAAARMAAATPATRREHTDLWRTLRADPTATGRTIVVDDVVAGAITCWERWGERQVGYWLGRDHWGRGVATTALALFLAEMTTRPVHAYVAPHNTASQRVLDKCGFRPDGVDGGDTLLGYVLEA